MTEEHPLPEGVDPVHLANRILAAEGGAKSPEALLVALLTDPTTGLFSRPYMRLRLDEECKRAFRFRIPLSVVLLGLVGSESSVPGDLILHLSGRLLGETRDIDSLGHWEGDRLLLLLPGTPASGARIMLGRIFGGFTALLEEMPGWRLFAGLVSYPSPEAVGLESLEAEALRVGPEALLAEAEAAWVQARDRAPQGARTGLAGPGAGDPRE